MSVSGLHSTVQIFNKKLKGVGGKSEKLTEKEKIATFYVILVPGREKQKKSTFDRASFLPAELIDLLPFCRAFFVDFLRIFKTF
ncbi:MULTISPECIES: hypothetical protein [Streptococcus]|nr:MULTISPECIES: hypothetical protein [Streptococcus]MBF9635714.1 hypothetical protein [Streptococcus pseudopneumoniae]